MPFYFGVGTAAPPADDTTNSAASTDTDHLRIAAASTGSGCFINALYIWGRASAASNISNIAVKILRMSAASTAGTAYTPQKRNTNQPAAASTFNTAPTVGTKSTTPDVEIGCLSAGAAYWMPYDPDAAVYLASGGAGVAANADVFSQGSAASLPFRYWLEFYER
jgi:hypothetical protein